MKSSKGNNTEKNRLNNKVFHLSFGSCNGCDIEVRACELFGYTFSNSHCDSGIILVTGLFDRKDKERILKSLDMRHMSTKRLILVDSCCISKGIFDGCKDDLLDVDELFKADACVFGCPPSPKEIESAIKLAGRK